MHLRLVLQQSRPELLVELLLLQHELNVSGRVIDLGFGGLDLGVELQLHRVRRLLGLREALEAEAAGLDVELDLLLVDIWDGDGEVHMVLFGVARA